MLASGDHLAELTDRSNVGCKYQRSHGYNANNVFSTAIDDYLADDGAQSESEKEQSDDGDVEDEFEGPEEPENDDANGEVEMEEQ